MTFISFEARKGWFGEYGWKRITFKMWFKMWWENFNDIPGCGWVIRIRLFSKARWYANKKIRNYRWKE